MVKMLKLLPFLGIDRLTNDDNLASQTGNYLRDAINVDIDEAGKIALRSSGEQVTNNKFTDLWQSPLHKDLFGRLSDTWVKINSDWSCEKLAVIGEGNCYHTLLNNRVIVAGKLGIFIYDGIKAKPLTIPTPPTPLGVPHEGGLNKGSYLIAIAWLSGEVQSAVSVISTVEVQHNGGVTIMLPMCLDENVTGVRVFASHPNGAMLYRLGDYPITTLQVTLTNDLLGRAEFESMSPMPTGKYLCVWRGRLITVSANRLMFSQPLAYHIHDERFDFFMLPQKITFVIPVNAGLWVGLTDSVVFLAGTSPQELSLVKKGSGSPLSGSAISIPPEALGEMAQGNDCALWLANNGFCVGLSSGEIVELHANKINDIFATGAMSVRLKDRVLAVLR